MINCNYIQAKSHKTLPDKDLQAVPGAHALQTHLSKTHVSKPPLIPHFIAPLLHGGVELGGGVEAGLGGGVGGTIRSRCVWPSFGENSLGSFNSCLWLSLFCGTLGGALGDGGGGGALVEGGGGGGGALVEGGGGGGGALRGEL